VIATRKLPMVAAIADGVVVPKHSMSNRMNTSSAEPVWRLQRQAQTRRFKSANLTHDTPRAVIDRGINP